MKTPALYPGRVRHKRFRPKVHAFSYPVYYLQVDVDQLDRGDSTTMPPCLSFNRFNVFSLKRSDFGRRGSSLSLRSQITQLLATVMPGVAPDHIMLFTMPRLLGYSFNPLSVYLCYDPGGQLAGVVYEVHNTYGERHFYVSAIAEGSRRARHRANKTFFVSPFYPVSGHYAFHLSPGPSTFTLAIEYFGADGERDLSASLCTVAIPLNAANLLKLFLGIPLVTLKVTIAIHVEALRLWLMRIRVFGRPSHLGDVTPCQDR